ncbi:MAG: posphoenolpyruvate synthetase regulatory kinase/phosphorylase PpsR [Gammaproteobacteria bacterium]
MRTVFFVSNRTAITAETLGNSLLGQFKLFEFREVTIPYVNTLAKAAAVVEKIERAAEQDGERPIVFSTVADAHCRDMIVGSPAFVLDLFHVFLKPLERELNASSREQSSRSHRIADYQAYEARMEAINFTLQHDDGAHIRQFDKADIILIGASRTGKTPTCLYMGLQFGIRAANYPITEEDMGSEQLPEVLRPHMSKLYGLTTSPERLHKIRSERRPGSRYAAIDQCRYELKAVENLYYASKIPFLSTITMSVEEIAATVMQERGLQRHPPRPAEN